MEVQKIYRNVWDLCDISQLCVVFITNTQMREGWGVFSPPPYLSHQVQYEQLPSLIRRSCLYKSEKFDGANLQLEIVSRQLDISKCILKNGLSLIPELLFLKALIYTISKWGDSLKNTRVAAKPNLFSSSEEINSYFLLCIGKHTVTRFLTKNCFFQWFLPNSPFDAFPVGVFTYSIQLSTICTVSCTLGLGWSPSNRNSKTCQGWKINVIV